MASCARARIISGWWPGSGCNVLTFSTALCQSSPKPISREAFFISASHQAYSWAAMATSSSGVYGIISAANSTNRASRPMGRPTMPLASRALGPEEWARRNAA